MSDAVVVGGGPAGAATALLLARAGLDVTVVERAAFPRRKVCGEYLGGGAVAALERLGLLDAVRGAGSALGGVRLVPPGAPAVTLRFPRASLACARERLDAILLDAARAAGATLVRARVEDVVAGEAVIVRDETGATRRIATPLVIGADGIGSIVARRAGLARPPRGGRFAVGGHYDNVGTFDGHVEMYIGGGAYFALNPLDATHANVMVVVPRTALAAWSRNVDAGIGGAAAALGRGVRSLDGARRIGPRVAVGPLAHAVTRAAAPGVALVGDAGGFLDPFTGQGVMLALTGAERLAAAVTAGARDRARAEWALQQYALTTARELATRARLCTLVAWLIAMPPLARRAAARLGRLPDAANDLLEALAGTRPATLPLPLLAKLVW